MGYYLFVKNDSVIASRESEPDVIVTSVAQLRKMLEDHNEVSFMCSSTMDFPEDETLSVETITLARAIRR